MAATTGCMASTQTWVGCEAGKACAIAPCCRWSTSVHLQPPTLAHLQEVVVTSSDSLGAPEAAAGGMSLGAFFARQPSAGGSSGRAEVYALKVS